MTPAPTARRLEVRHVQIARAALAAVAAIMVTFSPDHSAAIGLSIFSGFAFATGIVQIAAGWLVYSVDTRWTSVILGALSIIAGMAAGIAQLRTDAGFFVILISWALLTGLIETITGGRHLRAARREATVGAVRSEARDALTTGILTIALGLGLLLVPTQYALRYTIDEVNETFTLTGIIIGVGIFGAYAAIVAVYLAIAGFSPRKAPAIATLVTADDDRGSS